jgi:hypothetical protein
MTALRRQRAQLAPPTAKEQAALNAVGETLIRIVDGAIDCVSTALIYRHPVLPSPTAVAPSRWPPCRAPTRVPSICRPAGPHLAILASNARLEDVWIAGPPEPQSSMPRR